MTSTQSHDGERMRLTRFTFNLCFGLVLLCLFCVCQDAAAANLPPKKLLVYYGIPSRINGSAGNTAAAALQFTNYAYVVFGQDLEMDDPPGETKHADTIAVIATIHANASTAVYGYITIGTYYLDENDVVQPSRNYTDLEINTRVGRWMNMGVDGIFFDEFGFDYLLKSDGTHDDCNARSRQNLAVSFVHNTYAKPVIANGFIPSEVIGQMCGANWPLFGAPGGITDFYFYEDHQISGGNYVDPALAVYGWKAKADSIKAYLDYPYTRNFKIMSVTTAGADNAYHTNKFWYSWFSALMYGHEATGWGDYQFAASGPGADGAPFRERPPVTDAGTQFTDSAITVNGTLYTRNTDLGLIAVRAPSPPVQTDPPQHYAGFNPLHYVVTDLGILTQGAESYGSAGYSINGPGVATGDSGWYGNGVVRYHGFRRPTSGGMIDLGTLWNTGFDHSYARCINDLGAIVGFSDYYAQGTLIHGFKWTSPGTFTELTTAPAASIGNNFAMSINTNGQIVGYGLNSSGYYRGVRWDPTAPTQGADMGSLDPNGFQYRRSYAYALSPAGHIVGKSEIGVNGPFHGFRTSVGPLGESAFRAIRSDWGDDLGTLTGGTTSEAWGVNAYDEVTGVSAVSGGSRAVLTQAGKKISDTSFPAFNLGVLDTDTYSKGLGVNNSDRVVGFSGSSDTSPRVAFVWYKANGDLRKLNSLLSAGTGWSLTRANAINEAGKIVGWGYHNGLLRAFLLEPKL
jgi:hypothetical protein